MNWLKDKHPDGPWDGQMNTEQTEYVEERMARSSCVFFYSSGRFFSARFELSLSISFLVVVIFLESMVMRNEKLNQKNDSSFALKKI